ncbi:uncharacterized protein LOC117642645 [Thrips palmi]|uniref:Uncharacterized protein LOC117642645 n=1 Tax=Thrips palmi TaxID=161013 RepID=A0A6P8YSA1_THRPL|nr:uncharacterized protein LOC117642645 [Thrips palmi]
MNLAQLLVFSAQLHSVLSKAGDQYTSFAGPFLAYVHRLYPCQTNGSTTLHIRASHFNPAKPWMKQTLTGNTSMTFTITDVYWGRARMDVRSNNQWKENAFVFKLPGGACSILRGNIPSLFRILYNGVAADPKSPCRIPKGTYEFEDEPVDWVFPNAPIMPYGFYRFLGSFGLGSTIETCITAECQIIPKVV